MANTTVIQLEMCYGYTEPAPGVWGESLRYWATKTPDTLERIQQEHRVLFGWYGKQQRGCLVIGTAILRSMPGEALIFDPAKLTVDENWADQLLRAAQALRLTMREGQQPGWMVIPLERPARGPL